MPNIGLVGVVNATTDGVIGTSGKTYRVYDVVNSCGTTTSNISLYDGTSTSGTLICRLQGKTTDCVSQIFNAGKRFSNGVYLGFTGAGSSNVSVSLIMEI